MTKTYNENRRVLDWFVDCVGGSKPIKAMTLEDGHRGGPIETVSVVTAAMKGKAWRAGIGGEWAVASYLVARMAGAIKCRAADDLVAASTRVLSGKG